MFLSIVRSLGTDYQELTYNVWLVFVYTDPSDSPASVRVEMVNGISRVFINCD